MAEAQSTILTPEYIKEFEKTIKEFAMGDKLPNGDYVFDFISSGNNTNNELQVITEIIRSCTTYNEYMKIQSISNDVFANLFKFNDNMIARRNYIRKQGAIDGLIFAQKISIDQKDTANKDIKEQITNLINQHIDQQETGNVYF